MRRIYLLDLLDLFSSENTLSFGPKEGDPNWTKTVEEFEDNGFITKKETWISKDGTSKYFRSHVESKAKRREDVKLLESMLNAAVEKEEYEKAAQLRDRIKELKK